MCDMQRVVKGNGMVHLSLPSTEEGENNHHNKKGINCINESMASRLAALTKALKDKVPHKNGVINTSIKAREMKTEAKPTCLNGMTLPLTVTSHKQQHTTLKDSTSDFITKHCTGLLKKTTSHLSTTQSELECKVTKSLHALRHRQLTMSHSHTAKQIESQHSSTSNNFTSGSHQTIHDQSNEATPPSGSPNTSVSSDRSCSMDVCLTSPPCVPDSASHETMNLSSFSIQKHLQALETFVDDEATCSSSDEEEDDLLRRGQQLKQSKLNMVKQRWEKDRTHIGSQWTWLCHQITTINQKIYQLDSIIQSTHPKESIEFLPHNPFSTPCICGTQQQNEQQTNNDSSSSLTKIGTNGQYQQQQQQSQQGKTSKTTPTGIMCRPCTCQIKQMILSNPSLMSQQIHVKEFLGYSLPALLMEESSQTCARARALKRAPKRKLLRAKRRDSGTEEIGKDRVIDPTYHPFLSQLTDLSFTVWLDKAVHQILQEHSYASFPVQKRRKTAPAAVIDHSLSHITSSLRLERSKSFSPSPTPLDLSIERIGKGIPRKRNSTNTHSFSDDSAHATTPTLPRKRKSTTTPQYDIDNIIIPYSMASSTRLEKLEYKEIITPRWQEKLYANASKENGINGIMKEEEEDISDVVFWERHAKCEEKEKNRYLNFIGGNGSSNSRKRPRPNRSSTPEPSVLYHHGGSSCNSDHDQEIALQILPFPPRKFPLVSKELAALDKPGPPPKKVSKYVTVTDRCTCSSSSPSPLLSSEKSHTPILTQSSISSPLSSPLTRVSTPPDTVSTESPLSTTAKWTVASVGSSAVTSNQSSGLVLKLSKRT